MLDKASRKQLLTFNVFEDAFLLYFLQIIAIFSPKAVLHIYAVLGPFLVPFSKSPTYDLKVPI